MVSEQGKVANVKKQKNPERPERRSCSKNIFAYSRPGFKVRFNTSVKNKLFSIRNAQLR